MTRVELSPRRRSITQAAQADGFEFHLTIGFDDLGHPKEVFADGAKYGTQMSALLSDVCIIISRSLQCGTSPQQLAKSLGRVPDPMVGEGADRPASGIGVIIAALIQEAENLRGAV